MKRVNIHILLVALMTCGLGIVVYEFSGDSEAVVSEDQSATDAKFEEIYVIIKETGDYIIQMGDTNVRNFHYAKPHDSFMMFCPECAELWGKKKEGIVEVPVDRLKKLRALKPPFPAYQREALSLPTPSDERTASRPVEKPTTLEELDSILLLLKQQNGHIYTNKYTMEMQYHYLKKHTHQYPGVIVGCPDCIKLRTKQTQETELISKEEYDELIKLEKEHSDGQENSN